MGIYNLIDNTAADCLHTDIACSTAEPQQKYRLRMVSNRLRGWGWG